MGGDPIPGPWDELREWFEAWKATLPRGTYVPRRRARAPNYLHGNLNRRSRS